MVEENMFKLSGELSLLSLIFLTFVILVFYGLKAVELVGLELKRSI